MRAAVILRFLGTAAPWLSLLLLVALSQTLPNRVAPDGSAAARRVEIAAAMEGVPFFVGDWVGEDEAVPREAQKLLRPNAILSRRYRRPGGTWLHLLVVHCSDARDMLGHYPPICYPSAGWVAIPPPDPDVHVILDDRPVPVRTYMF
ncbi:MAG: exosortase-associated EpsI family protein, partial [Planctomycetota bacterium]|nr:exosortase-associated EpsI family protein [Planctomycetota bacterium]